MADNLIQSKQDKQAYADRIKAIGRPVIYVGPNNRRNRAKEKEILNELRHS